MKSILGCALFAMAGGMSCCALAQTALDVDWSGFYAGGFIGATDSQSDARTATGRLHYFNITDANQIGRAGKNALDQWGASGGLVAGYGKQFGNVLVGIEASAQNLSLDKKHATTETYESLPSKQLTIRQSVSADWMAGLRLRLGWAERNWLAYATAGVAATRLKLDATFSDNAWSGYSHASTSDWVTGASLGFGGEYALSPKWSLRGEYLYTRFGKVSTVSDVTSINDPGGTLIHKANLDNHGLYVGLTYRF